MTLNIGFLNVWYGKGQILGHIYCYWQVIASRLLALNFYHYCIFFFNFPYLQQKSYCGSETFTFMILLSIKINKLPVYILKISGIELDLPYRESRLLIAKPLFYTNHLFSFVMLHDCLVFVSNRIAMLGDWLFTQSLIEDSKIVKH
jgi:hypothetical protein